MNLTLCSQASWQLCLHTLLLRQQMPASSENPAETREHGHVEDLQPVQSRYNACCTPGKGAGQGKTSLPHRDAL